MEKNRRYWVICKTNDFRVKSLVKGENSLERAQKLVEFNKATCEKYGLYACNFIRRVKHYNKIED